LEIVEALKWLRAAGFPQYAQMFEEGQFPVDLGVIERDHDFLDQDSLKSLFRRLEKLNKYADLSLDTLPGKKVSSEEDEEEDLCALSDRWEYKKSAGRWSRKGVTSSSRHATAMGSDQTDMTGHSESQDSLLDHDTCTPRKEAIPNSFSHSVEQESNSHRPQVKFHKNATREQDLNDVFVSARPIPVADEKSKSSNNLFRKMDVLKNKRSRGMSKRRNILDISGPIVEDSDHLRAKLERLNCVDISPSSKTVRPELSAGGHVSTLGSRASSVERTENPGSSEFTSSHATVQSSTNSHSLVQPSSTSNIMVQHPPASHSSVQSVSFSHTNVQSPPTSHTSVKSLSSSCIPVQSPPFSQFPVQSPPYSTSKTTLSVLETNPQATKPPATPNSSTLKNSPNHNIDILSSAKQTPLDGDCKLNTHFPNTATQSLSSSKGVTHSSSLDSYFQDSSGNNDIDSGELTDSQPTLAQKEYDDFDLILQQLYQNINELSDYVSRETGESMSLFDPETHFTSLVKPISSPDINNSLEFDGALDLDPENSFSGGEGSNTAESSSEDPELVATDVSRDSLDEISSVPRERRDSGVGHSLPRAPSERRQKKLRWNSFQNSHKPDVNSRAMQINQLTVYQMVRLQKLCLLKLTAIMEKCLPVSRSGWNWMMPRFMKKPKIADFIDRKVFGVPLNVMAQRTGQPLPQCVLHAMRYLRRTSPNAVGIFRKSGVKSKIQQLRDYLEAHPDTVNFEGVNAYNVADMLKTYFRDLPECLLTNKMSEIFRSIYMHVPPSQRLEALQTAIVLLPDENREVLQSILLFLSDISSHEADHQMNANNLAVCFTPTVFQLGPQHTVTAQSPKRNHKTSIAVPDPREMMEQKAAHECLLMMILECKKLFTVFPSLYQQLQVHAVPQIMPVPLLDIGCAPSDVRSFGQERIQIILKEAHDKNRGWLQAFMVGDVEVFLRKPMDDCPLKEWKLVVEIEAPPIEVLHRILHERHVWDEDLLSWSVVERLDPHSDIFQFVLNSMAPHPFRHFCVLRYWRSDLNKGACALITMSVEHSHPMEVQGVWAVDLGSYFLMEHCGSGRSRLTYITRLDTRGRSPEWYTRIFGHICANFLTRLKESFRQVTQGPETRV
ncbi:unnamed protein product, partial [Candidula unifasciata]